MKYGKSKVLIVKLWDLSGYSENSNFQEIQFLTSLQKRIKLYLPFFAWYLVALLPCYLVSSLPRYYVTMLLCNPVTLLPCYSVILLLCYHVTLFPCYAVT